MWHTLLLRSIHAIYIGICIRCWLVYVHERTMSGSIFLYYVIRYHVFMLVYYPSRNPFPCSMLRAFGSICKFLLGEYVGAYITETCTVSLMLEEELLCLSLSFKILLMLSYVIVMIHDQLQILWKSCWKNIFFGETHQPTKCLPFMWVHYLEEGRFYQSLVQLIAGFFNLTLIF